MDVESLRFDCPSPEIISSDLGLLKTLVGPLESGSSALVLAYEQLVQQPRTRLLPWPLAEVAESALKAL